MIEDPYLKLTRRERAELLDEVSRRRNLAPAILEKDYWVCLTLGALFSLPDIGEHMVFKGGTSLSKVFGLIDRFSEDVDISFHRDYLGFADDDHDPEAASSNKQQKSRIEDLQAACVTCIRETLLPALSTKMASILGSTKDWSIEVDALDPQTLLFHYPQAGTSELSYIKPSVKIELGARSDHWPRGTRAIRSYLGESLELPIGDATVQALAAERTFWEKATLLHAQCHRPPDKTMPARYARHYHDMARLAESPVAERALAAIEELPLTEGDAKGDIYEHLLGKLSTAGIAGQFSSPRHVIRAMVEMLDPRKPELPGNPACPLGDSWIASPPNVRADCKNPARTRSRNGGISFLVKRSHGCGADAASTRRARAVRSIRRVFSRLPGDPFRGTTRS